MDEFIEINGVIYDKEEYDEEVKILKSYLEMEVKEAVSKYGFEVVDNQNFIDSGILLFSNRRLNIDLVLKVQRC